MKVKISDPANETIIDKAQYIAEQSYDLMESISDNEFAIKSKFKYAIVDLVFYISLAEGSVDYPSIYDWVAARKNAVALRSMHRLAGRNGLIDIKPEIMISIDELIKEVDYNTEQAQDSLKKREESEIEPWLKKYKLWKEMQK